MISRVTVDLPLVPEIETTGTRRSASRIQAGGEVRAAAMRSVQRVEQPLLGTGQLRGPRRRDVALGEGDGRLGQDPGALLAAPRERDDPVAGVGRAMDRQAGPALAMIHAQPADPGDDRGDGVRPVAGGHGRAEPDQGVAAGIALAVPGPPPTDRDLHLDHRLEPVDVRSLEQADLDQSHGPRQDSNPVAA